MVTFRKPLDEATQHPVDIEALLQKHKVVFRDLPAGRPPDRGFEHIVELEKGTQAVITLLTDIPRGIKMRSRVQSRNYSGWDTSNLAPVPLHLQ